MPLDSKMLSTKIKEAFLNSIKLINPDISPETTQFTESLANELSKAIDQYIKKATVTTIVETEVETDVTVTTPTGPGVGVGKGKGTGTFIGKIS